MLSTEKEKGLTCTGIYIVKRSWVQPRVAQRAASIVRGPNAFLKVSLRPVNLKTLLSQASKAGGMGVTRRHGRNKAA